MLTWMKRYIPGAAPTNARIKIWEKWEKQHECLSLKPYIERKYEASRNYLFRQSLGVEDPDGVGERVLLLSRVNGLMLKDKISWSRPWPCSLCKVDGGESSLCEVDEWESSLTHLMIQCEALKDTRELMRPTIETINTLPKDPSESELVTLLFGGETHRVWIPHWVSPCLLTRNVEA